jgi:hypothetical protein
MTDTDAITDSAGLSGPIEEKAAPKKRTAKSTVTQKVSEDAPEIIEASIVEAVVEEKTEDGQTVITGPKKQKAPRKSNTRANNGGVVSSNAADYALSKKQDLQEKKAEKEKEKTALWSASNVRWSGVGSLSKGYNIINKEAAEKWLTRNGVREATPEEVATHYGK